MKSGHKPELPPWPENRKDTRVWEYRRNSDGAVTQYTAVIPEISGLDKVAPAFYGAKPGDRFYFQGTNTVVRVTTEVVGTAKLIKCYSSKKLEKVIEKATALKAGAKE